MRRTIAIAALALLMLLALLTGSAPAETTHRFIKQLNLPVNGIKPMGVDPQGNVIVFAEGAIHKFSPNGEPVAFTALGTNTIDGSGGGDCPATPSDCDETPFNVLGEAAPELTSVLADMNQSTSGPTAGYMYVAAVKEIEGRMRSQIVVFDATGKYRGQIDTTQPTPSQSPEDVPSYLSVAPHGTIVVTYNNDEGGLGDSFHADKYQPVDADPADDAFVGQLRKDAVGGSNALASGGFALGTVADDDSVYVGRGGSAFSPTSYHPIWELYDAESFGQPQGNTEPVNLDPERCECDSAGPWGDGGLDEESGYLFEYASVNPADHHVFILDTLGSIEEWGTPTEKVGATFGDSSTIGGATSQLAFDTSGIASTNGRIYVSRGNSLAVFSAPVPIPDVEDIAVTVGHESAQVSATLDLDHGPTVNSCRVQWGEEFPGQPVSYSHSTPCEPPAPYSAESTAVSATVTGLTPEVDYSVRVEVKTNNGVNHSRPVKMRSTAVLAVETEAADEVTRTTARLHGSLDPDGIETTFWFEYGINTSYRERTGEAPAGEGHGVVPVPPPTIEKLQPGRRYHFRLVAHNSLGTTYGEDRTFLAAAPPAISGVKPSGVQETGATLNAQINPGGYPTSYQFEYGPTPDYGIVSPAGPGSVGEGESPVPVSTQLSGLQAGVEYHFRVVATNQWGTERSEDSTFTFFPSNCPNAYARQLTRSAYLPDCRAYELVSPRNAGGIQLYPGDLTQDYIFYNFIQTPYFKTTAQNLGTADSPGRFTFLGLSGALPGTNPPNSVIDSYTATRTANGWVSRYWGLPGDQTIGAGGAKCNLQMNICIDYRVPEVLLNTDPEFVGSHAPYVWDFEGHSLGRWPTNLGVVKGGEAYVGDDHPSPDFSHYVFSSNNVRFTTDGVLKAPGSVYDNDIEDASVEKISKLPSGDDIPAGVGTGGEEEYLRIPAVSTDGSHVLMTTLAPGGVNLYMRVNDAITYEIAPGKTSIHLIGMTSDGSKVAFSSRDHVTTDDTDYPFSEDIYLWEESTNEITRISQGNAAGNSNACQPAEGILCAATPLETKRPDSDDVMASLSGDVYFYSPEQLDPQSPGLYNERNLYVYRHGAVKYVATLDPGTSIDRMQISPDGSHVAFLTAARLTSYDNQGWREMYTFNPETGVVRCVSCIPSGEPPQVVRPPEDLNAQGTERAEPSRDVMASQSGRFMADDGRTAFATSDALVESDTDERVDVYEFVAGRPQLITSGTSQNDLLAGNRFYPGEYTGLESISRDGVDIYFSTYDTLAPQEDENGEFLKFYDARTNGGFPPSPAKLPCLAADECHGDENAGPPASLIGTGSNLGPPAKPAKKKAEHKKKHRKHAKRHRRQRKGGRR